MGRYPGNRGAIALLAVLAACGGGGDDPPAPMPVNRPPSFTSPSSVSVPENSVGTIYTASASDPDGQMLSFAIAGGADAARFTISAAGALSFVNPPDFENPADADGNNSYLVRISASDGSATATLDLTVTVSNTQTGGFVVRRVGTGFEQPLYVAALPGDASRMFVVERAGRIRILDLASGAATATPILDIAGEVSTDGERGLLGFATAPDFAASGTFYIYLTVLDGDIELRRYRTPPSSRSVADPTTADVVLRIEHSRFSNHNGGWIDFGPDGFLYLGVGDGGGSGDPDNNGQNRSVLLGKILRLDVNGDAFPDDPERDYAIPPGNPFASAEGAPEVWAYGLRNPFRGSFDRATGNLLFADVGQNMVEEVNLMRPGDSGANFGWRVREGTQPFQGTTTETLVNPVLEYLHGSGPRQGQSITGGYVYRGPVKALLGHYFFADFIAGNIWSVPLQRLSVGTTLPSDEFTIRTMDFAPDQGMIANPVSFGVDAAGNLYIVDFDGEIFRVEAT